MGVGWDWTEDRQWAHSKWSKRLLDGDSKIIWFLEVQIKDVFIGELQIKGTINGDLTLAIQRIHEDFS